MLDVLCVIVEDGSVWKSVSECPDRDKRLLTSLLQIHIKKIDIPGTVSVIS